VSITVLFVVGSFVFAVLSPMDAVRTHTYLTANKANGLFGIDYVRTTLTAVTY